MNQMQMNNSISRNELTLNVVQLLGLRTKRPVNLNTKEVAVSCPYHKDKTPSMFVNFETGVFHCFSCGRSGSIESLYKDITGQSIYKALGINSDPFSAFSFNSKPVYNYSFEESTSLKNVYLNFDSSIIKDFKKYPDVIDYLKSRGISIEIAEAANFGYIEEGSINTTKFIRRLVIPIYEQNRLISIEGRRVYPEDPDPKVLYPRNATVNTLYDYENLDKNKPCFAVEGLMDLFVLRSSKAMQNSTSIFGANLTKRQIKLIGEFSQFIYIPDNDEAGQKTVEALKNSGLKNIYVLPIPKQLGNFNPKDVGDFPKAGVTVDNLLDKKWLSYVKKL